MKHLLIIPFETNFTVLNRMLTTMEAASRLANNGEDVTLLYCDGKNTNMCWVNTRCDKRMCKICSLFRNSILKLIPNTVTLLPASKVFKDSIDDYKNLTYDYQNRDELKSITYKGVSIGYAALSSYITPTRNLNPLVNQEFHNNIDPILQAMSILTDVFYAAVDYCRPDQVGVYNSRFVISRPIFDICKAKGIFVNVFEPAAISPEGKYFLNYPNVSVHDIRYNSQLINDIWDSDAHPTDYKQEIANQFFINRRNAIPAGDKVYVKHQQTGLLPENWDNSKHNIVIFNSSEDEYASLGEEFEHNLYPSQYVGIKDIFEKNKNNKNYHFYLRIHPNLKDIPYAYHKKLHSLGNISDNITIIPGDSAISTYSLIDAAEKIIVFGSTTGIESVYWGKPVILLAKCIYSYMDICYIPKNIEQIQEYIHADLVPKEKLPTLKIAYYRLCDELPTFQYFQYRLGERKIFGKRISIYDLKIKGRKLSKLKINILLHVGSIYRNIIYKTNRPTAEDPNIL